MGANGIETAPATRGDVQWVAFVGATTSFVTYVVAHIIGGMPPEIYGFIQYGVPLGMSGLAAEVRWRIARRRGRDDDDAK